jgi:NAD(P)-dependent dehydrogenase (short-subunit alcohol dehydrogenase family)
MSDLLQGKVAVINGAAGGIGRAIAHRFARDGAALVLADIDEVGGRALAQTLSGNAHFVRTDTTDDAQVRAMIDAAREKFGRVDILVNNAGLPGDDAAFTEVGNELWNRILAVNLTGTFFAMRAAIPAMVAAGGGSIVNNASVLGLVGFANHAAYSASKGGVIALTREAAVEYGSKGVRVNCICPGFIETPMIAGAKANAAILGAMLKVLHPLGRLGRAEEIAELALFLASPQSSFMTGAVIPVDGGFSAR